MKKIFALIAMVFLPLFAGCGGGDDGTFVPIVSFNTAVLKLSSQPQSGLPAGKAVSGVVVSVEMPAGVTVKTGTNNVVDPSVVVPSGLMAGTAGILGPITYTPAAGATKATLDFSVASTAPAGVGVGEYVTVNFTLAGVAPTAADFNVTTFDVADLTASPIPTLTAKKDLTLK